jgi:hypothetical protein
MTIDQLLATATPGIVLVSTSIITYPCKIPLKKLPLDHDRLGRKSHQDAKSWGSLVRCH